LVYRVVLAIVGAAIGACMALVARSVVWPEITDLAGASITATSTVAGAALGVVGAVVIWPRH